ncbi:MAG: prepilin-type N-terminal cleavage/methylation domain-containing protein [Nitrospinae bacterium]|nr:prepilin-type N-terminal cleavage/methylation domain-containing protein [Nitrospinota bacterium]
MKNRLYWQSKIKDRKSKIKDPNKGFSLVELLVAITVTSIVIVTVAISLTTPLKSHEEVEEKREIGNLVTKTMDDRIAQGYDALSVGTTSDQVSIDGEWVNRDVIISIYEQDTTSGAEIKEIIVKIGDVQLETLKSNYEHNPKAPPPGVIK